MHRTPPRVIRLGILRKLSRVQHPAASQPPRSSGRRPRSRRTRRAPLRAAGRAPWAEHPCAIEGHSGRACSKRWRSIRPDCLNAPRATAARAARTRSTAAPAATPRTPARRRATRCRRLQPAHPIHRSTDASLRAVAPRQQKPLHVARLHEAVGVEVGARRAVDKTRRAPRCEENREIHKPDRTRLVEIRGAGVP